jgi:hypothetical protein
MGSIGRGSGGGGVGTPLIEGRTVAAARTGGLFADALASHTPQRRQKASSGSLAVPQSQQLTLPHSSQAGLSSGRAALQL